MKTFFMPILYRCGTKNCAGGGGVKTKSVFYNNEPPIRYLSQKGLQDLSAKERI